MSSPRLVLRRLWTSSATCPEIRRIVSDRLRSKSPAQYSFLPCAKRECGFRSRRSPAVSHRAFIASMIHITIPPISREAPMMVRLSRCLPIILLSKKCRNCGGDDEGDGDEAERMSEGGAVAALSHAETWKEIWRCVREKNRQAQDGSELYHDCIHLPVAAGGG